MAFQVSPGVLVQERDLTRIIPAVSTSIGAVAGSFNKGPLDEIVSISSEQELVETFGKPDSSNFEYFFSAANFLQYSNSLRVVRATQTSAVNASTSGTGVLVKNTEDWQNNYASGGNAGNADFVAREAGTDGNNLLVSTCPSATAYEEEGKTTLNDSSTSVGDTTVTFTSGTGINVGDIIAFSTTAGTDDYDDGEQYRVTGISTNDITFVQHPRGSGGLKRTLTDGCNIRRRWRYYDAVDGSPGTSAWTSDRSGSGDEIHVVVVDEDGGISGAPGTILETYSKLSKASDAKDPQGNDNYYPNVIYTKSQHIYWTKHNSSGSNWGNAASGTTFTSVTAPTSDSMSGGSNGSTVTTGQLKDAYDKFADSETVDVGLIIAGPCDSTHIENLITIAEARKDCVVFVSPERSDVVNVTNSNTQKSNVLSFYSSISSSSYAFFDSGYKYMYDRYNDVYRYVPLNGDMAGLAARTDLIADSWFSPAGFNRGVVRGAVKLAFNPTKTQRDELYPKRVNPVSTFPGQGTVLFGDKTALDMHMEQGVVEIEAMTYIRGRSISNAFMIVDEAQNLTTHELKTIITRVGHGTKLVLTGDIQQIDNSYVDAVSNGLTHAVEKFKNYEIAGHISLKKGERSQLATLAAEIL